MKLRIIILILSLLSFLSTLTGGSLYYSALKSAAIKRVERQGGWHAETIKNQFDQLIRNNQRAVLGLSGHDEMQQVLVETNKVTLDDANKILDNFNTAFEANVSYLMDREGNTIASSNRKDSDSFVGKNYAFRPYFKGAIQGVPKIYVALGVTSGKRGIYFSHTVYNNASQKPLGVVVMKAPVDTIESELLRTQFNTHGMITLVTDPNSLIFMSTRDKHLFHTLEDIPNKSDMKKSMQFGDKPLKWSGFEIKSGSTIMDQPGNEYIFSRKAILTLPGWDIIHLHNKKEVLKAIYEPFIGKLLSIIFALFIFTGVAVFILYRMAHDDLKRRRAAEEALQASEQRYRRLTENAKDMIYRMSLPDGQYEFVNSASEDVFGYKPKEFYESPVLIRNVIHPDWHHYFNEHWALLLEGKMPPFYEYQIIHKSGEIKWINQRNVLIRDNNKNPVAIEGILTDISGMKQTEKKLQSTKDLLSSVFQSTADGILVVNQDGNIIFHNKRFQELWRISDNLITSRDDKKILGFVLDQLENPDAFLAKVNELYNTDKEDFDTLYFIDGRIFERYSLPLFQDGKIAGRVWSFRNVTEKKQSEAEREKLIVDLQQALNEVRTLRGILPICAHCKKIRDDKGYWNNLEAYIQEHSEVSFSHGMCLDCSDELYGKEDWYIEMKNEEKKKE